eukprot:TRINITY_DN1715_c2_g1_i1.p1 TRINITY_DN1715_c2_g1~~TRINITY_DN1715_c2_g1_i1.p1  ORF type:complete len:336 (+),score=30.87 TRINITY_DN1715_c2_g1_i1:27-1010(+)
MHKLLFGAFCAVGTYVEIAVKRRLKERQEAAQSRTLYSTRSLPLLPGQALHQQITGSQSNKTVKEDHVIPVNLRVSTTYFIIFLRLIQLIISYFIINNVQNDSTSTPRSALQLMAQIILVGILEAFCWQTNNLHKSLVVVSKKLRHSNENQQLQELEDGDDIDGGFAQDAGLSEKEQQQHLQRKLTGTWIKDKELSDSMEGVMDLMQLGGIIRTAVKLVRGVRIEVTEDNLEAAVFSIFPWYKIIERYPLNGEKRDFKRRDFRSGKHTAYVEAKASKIILRIVWDDPLGGVCTEVFTCPQDDQLRVDTTTIVHGKTVQYTTMYRKQL